jgi:GntR family transcriptional regulator
MLERRNPKPLYAQLQDIILEKIESEYWKPHDVIPSENELSKEYGVSRMTARSVVSHFVREGLLYRVQGKGTFVAEPKITTTSLSYMGIREQLERMGYQTGTKLIKVQKISCPVHILKTLLLPKESVVFMIERLRYVKGEPLSIHTSYIPATCCNNLEGSDLEGEQLCVILDKEYGLKRGKVIETLESTLASDREADLLSVRSGYPLLLLQDIIYNTEGKPFEYTKVIFRGDKIKISFQYDARNLIPCNINI